MIKVFLVDDHPMVIEGLRQLLYSAINIQIIGSATDGFAAIQALRQKTADVVMVDINLPDLDGIELCKKLKERFPKIKVLGLSTFKERSYITRMIDAGASGYLLKNVNGEELIEAIEAVHRGRLYMSMDIAQAISRPNSTSPTLPLLTSREKEVLTLIADGLTNHEIAEKLFISHLTVDSHRKNLLAKFGVKNTAAMVKYGMEAGFI